jgi:hypothetical protein
VLTRTYLRNGLTLLGLYVILYGLTQWVEVARGLSAYQAGLALIPMGACSAITARRGARHRRGHELTLTAHDLTESLRPERFTHLPEGVEPA